MGSNGRKCTRTDIQRDFGTEIREILFPIRLNAKLPKRQHAQFTPCINSKKTTLFFQNRNRNPNYKAGTLLLTEIHTHNIQALIAHDKNKKKSVKVRCDIKQNFQQNTFRSVQRQFQSTDEIEMEKPKGTIEN